jgi:hypothetical protein
MPDDDPAVEGAWSHTLGHRLPAEGPADLGHLQPATGCPILSGRLTEGEA